MKYINYGSQTIEKNDLLAVQNALTQRYLTTGPIVSNFEKKFAKYVKAKFTVASNSKFYF